MQIESGFRCNGIVLISAPRAGEEGASRRLSEDLEQLATSLGDFIFRHITVSSKAELITLLKSLEPEVNNGFRPILHFDFHGSKELGLEIGVTGEFVSWAAITNKLRKLNAACDNNLFVFVAACYGHYLVKALNIMEPCPFFIMFGPTDLVTFGELESSVAPFYTQLFETGSVDDATKAFSREFEYVHAERMFLITFAKYVREKCLGKGGKQRRENLLTETFSETSLSNTTQSRPELRKKIKRQLEPTPELMDKLSKSFLHGKGCSVPFEKVMSEVKKSYA
jgi:hypothetical protein